MRRKLGGGQAVGVKELDYYERVSTLWIQGTKCYLS